MIFELIESTDTEETNTEETEETIEDFIPSSLPPTPPPTPVEQCRICFENETFDNPLLHP